MNDIVADPVRLPFLKPIAFAEGTTLLALVFIGMPLKYGFGITAANAVLGPLHGVVFLAYAAAVAAELFVARHSIEWLIQAGLASIIPGGTFWFFTARRA
jgi:integral membrane protein